MTEREHQRLVNHRLAVIRHAEEVTGNVAQTCRYFGITRQTFYVWLRRYQEKGLEGLRDKSRRPHHSTNATSAEVFGKIIYLRQIDGLAQRRSACGAHRAFHPSQSVAAWTPGAPHPRAGGTVGPRPRQTSLGSRLDLRCGRRSRPARRGPHLRDGRCHCPPHDKRWNGPSPGSRSGAFGPRGSLRHCSRHPPGGARYPPGLFRDELVDGGHS